MSTIVNLVVDDGIHKNFEFGYLEPDTNLPLPLDSYSAKMQIRARPGYGDVLVEFSTENHKLVLGAGSGTIKILFEPQDFDTDKWTKGFYDLYITKISDGTKTRIAHGMVTVLQGITE